MFIGIINMCVFKNDGADFKNSFQTNHTRQKHIINQSAEEFVTLLM
jgi:hypothetical protein